MTICCCELYAAAVGRRFITRTLNIEHLNIEHRLAKLTEADVFSNDTEQLRCPTFRTRSVAKSRSFVGATWLTVQTASCETEWQRLRWTFGSVSIKFQATKTHDSFQLHAVILLTESTCRWRGLSRMTCHLSYCRKIKYSFLLFMLPKLDLAHEMRSTGLIYVTR